MNPANVQLYQAKGRYQHARATIIKAYNRAAQTMRAFNLALSEQKARYAELLSCKKANPDK